MASEISSTPTFCKKKNRGRRVRPQHNSSEFGYWYFVAKNKLFFRFFFATWNELTPKTHISVGGGIFHDPGNTRFKNLTQKTWRGRFRHRCWFSASCQDCFFLFSKEGMTNLLSVFKSQHIFHWTLTAFAGSCQAQHRTHTYSRKSLNNVGMNG